MNLLRARTPERVILMAFQSMAIITFGLIFHLPEIPIYISGEKIKLEDWDAKAFVGFACLGLPNLLFILMKVMYWAIGLFSHKDHPEIHLEIGD